MIKSSKKSQFYVLYGLIITLLCYGLSPVISFCTTDSSVFYCVGKVMANGGVAYTDFFDHKGLWLYFFNCIGAWISKVLPGFGMYFVESIFAICNLFVVDAIIGHFVNNEKSKVVSTGLFFGLSFFYFTYMGGNFTETYALTFQLISILLIVKYYFGSEAEHPAKYMFIHGICSGICLFLRMNLVAMWVPFGICLTVKLLKEKRIKNLLVNYLALICGVVAVTIPVILYGIMNNCMSDMFFCMYTFNMSYLNDGAPVTVFLKELLLSPASLVLYCSVIGTILVVVSKTTSKEFKLLTVLSFIFTFAITFMGMRAYGHYYQTILPFSLPLFVALGKILDRGKKAKKTKFIGLIIVCFILTLCGNLLAILKYTGISTDYKELSSTLELCAEIIQDDPQKDSLLSTGNFMQAYVICDICPSVKYPYVPGTTYEAFPIATDTINNEIISGTHKYIFGYKYFDGYWYSFGDDINIYIAANYEPIVLSEVSGYVMFMRIDK